MFTLRNKIGSILKSVILLFLAIIIITPLLLLFVGSLKDDRVKIEADFGSYRAFLVHNPSLNNFKEIAGSYRFFVNSLIILSVTVIGTLIVSSLFAFVLLKGKFRFNKILLLVVITLYIIPQESIMLPMLFEAIKLNLLNTFIIQIIPFLAGPLYIFLFYQFFKEVPASIAESAQIDGASLWSIFTAIYLPLSVPAIVTVVILQGMESWNQFLWPLLVTQTERVRPITVAIASYFSTDTIFWDQVFAISVLMLIPILTIYLIFQKYFIASVSSSAIKE